MDVHAVAGPSRLPYRDSSLEIIESVKATLENGFHAAQIDGTASWSESTTQETLRSNGDEIDAAIAASASRKKTNGVYKTYDHVVKAVYARAPTGKSSVRYESIYS